MKVVDEATARDLPQRPPEALNRLKKVFCGRIFCARPGNSEG
jgi:hypothetical protein